MFDLSMHHCEYISSEIANIYTCDSKNGMGSRGLLEIRPFFSLFLMRKPLFRGQKWLLRPYFPLIRGMFLLRSGLGILFRVLEVPEPRVRKRALSH